MKEKTSLLVGLIVALAILNLVGFMVVGSNKIDEQALSDKVTAQVIGQIDIPTASEIAAGIVVPEVVIPEPKEVNSDRIDDLWEDLYKTEIEKLETKAYDVAELELENRDYKALTKWLESIEGFDELKNVDVEDYEINIIELGLEEDEDKIAEVVFELKIKYILDEGQATKFKKNVLATAIVTFDEGDFSDEDVELVFA
ncbi:MAG: hypothetical protein ACTSPI_01260 [Candidatus Heimdallarchaeaceae archaeon]